MVIDASFMDDKPLPKRTGRNPFLKFALPKRRKH